MRPHLYAPPGSLTLGELAQPLSMMFRADPVLNRGSLAGTVTKTVTKPEGESEKRCNLLVICCARKDLNPQPSDPKLYQTKQMHKDNHVNAMIRGTGTGHDRRNGRLRPRGVPLGRLAGASPVRVPVRCNPILPKLCTQLSLPWARTDARKAPAVPTEEHVCGINL